MADKMKKGGDGKGLHHADFNAVLAAAGGNGPGNPSQQLPAAKAGDGHAGEGGKDYEQGKHNGY